MQLDPMARVLARGSSRVKGLFTRRGRQTCEKQIKICVSVILAESLGLACLQGCLASFSMRQKERSRLGETPPAKNSESGAASP